MTDLSIIRKNFNTLIDSYEREGVTVEDIESSVKRRSEMSTLLCTLFMEGIVKESVPLFSKEIEDKFSNSAVELVKSGVDIGMCNYLSMLAKEDFVENNLEVK